MSNKRFFMSTSVTQMQLKFIIHKFIDARITSNYCSLPIHITYYFARISNLFWISKLFIAHFYNLETQVIVICVCLRKVFPPQFQFKTNKFYQEI